MEQMPAGDISTETLRARRLRMSAQARGLRPAYPRPAQFQTPLWLDQSFVLPATARVDVDVPSQSVPHHDDKAEPVEIPVSEQSAEAPPGYLRPPTSEVDFARLVRRSDLSRFSARTVIASGGMAGLALIAFLLISWPVALGMAIAFGLVALAASGARVRLAMAPIPYLDR